MEDYDRKYIHFCSKAIGQGLKDIDINPYGNRLRPQRTEEIQRSRRNYQSVEIRIRGSLPASRTSMALVLLCWSRSDQCVMDPLSTEPWWWNVDVDTSKSVLLPNRRYMALDPNRWLCALSGSRQNPCNERRSGTVISITSFRNSHVAMPKPTSEI